MDGVEITQEQSGLLDVRVVFIGPADGHAAEPQQARAHAKLLLRLQPRGIELFLERGDHVLDLGITVDAARERQDQRYEKGERQYPERTHLHHRPSLSSPPRRRLY